MVSQGKALQSLFLLHAFAHNVQASSGSGEEAGDEGESSGNDEDAEYEDHGPPTEKANVMICCHRTSASCGLCVCLHLILLS